MILWSLSLFISTVAAKSPCASPIDWDVAAARTSDGRAQLHGLDSPDKFSGRYIVRLWHNHTYEAHLQAIGRDASVFLDFVWIGSGYRAKLDDDLLDLIRQDPGVLWVTTNKRVHLIEPVSEESRIEKCLGRLLELFQLLLTLRHE
jgi:hypothetical protein